MGKHCKPNVPSHGAWNDWEPVMLPDIARPDKKLMNATKNSETAETRLERKLDKSPGEGQQPRDALFAFCSCRVIREGRLGIVGKSGDGFALCCSTHKVTTMRPGATRHARHQCGLVSLCFSRKSVLVQECQGCALPSFASWSSAAS